MAHFLLIPSFQSSIFHRLFKKAASPTVFDRSFSVGPWVNAEANTWGVLQKNVGSTGIPPPVRRGAKEETDEEAEQQADCFRKVLETDHLLEDGDRDDVLKAKSQDPQNL
ncbi:hypothetical protein EAI_09660 [Harpegnathos saltator]|uniref:Uncharacterized protein n=1 Tax=Harpegnathos saltator TaxID=610380 RepID=E2C9Y2_HARSA|nr:hypothetical protein EAI_09660 [Harpegnathos saltator]